MIAADSPWKARAHALAADPAADAALRAAAIGAVDDAPLLIGLALGDQAAPVRLAAVRRVAAVQPRPRAHWPEQVDQLLQHPDREVRTAAVDLLDPHHRQDALALVDAVRRAADPFDERTAFAAVRRMVDPYDLTQAAEAGGPPAAIADELVKLPPEAWAVADRVEIQNRLFAVASRPGGSLLAAALVDPAALSLLRGATGTGHSSRDALVRHGLAAGHDRLVLDPGARAAVLVRFALADSSDYVRLTALALLTETTGPGWRDHLRLGLDCGDPYPSDGIALLCGDSTAAALRIAAETPATDAAAAAVRLAGRLAGGDAAFQEDLLNTLLARPYWAGYERIWHPAIGLLDDPAALLAIARVPTLAEAASTRLLQLFRQSATDPETEPADPDDPAGLAAAVAALKGVPLQPPAGVDVETALHSFDLYRFGPPELYVALVGWADTTTLAAGAALLGDHMVPAEARRLWMERLAADLPPAELAAAVRAAINGATGLMDVCDQDACRGTITALSDWLDGHEDPLAARSGPDDPLDPAARAL